MKKNEILNSVDPMENYIVFGELNSENTNVVLSLLHDGRRVRGVSVVTPDTHTAKVLSVSFRKKEGTLVEKMRGLNQMNKTPIFPVRQIQMKDHLPKGEAAKGWVLSQVAEFLRPAGPEGEFEETIDAVKNLLRNIFREKGIYLQAIAYVGKTGVEHVRLYDFAEEAKPYDKVHNKLFDEAVAEFETALSPDKIERTPIRYKVLDE